MGVYRSYAPTEIPRLLRIKPGKPNDSYLVQKIEGTPGIAGLQEPPGCPGSPLNGAQCLSADDISAIRRAMTLRKGESGFFVTGPHLAKSIDSGFAATSAPGAGAAPGDGREPRPPSRFCRFMKDLLRARR